MSCKVNSRMFGPVHGPVVNRVPSATSGRWIPITRGLSNPLNAGEIDYVTTWKWYDDPEVNFNGGGSPGGNGGGGGGGGGGVGQRPIGPVIVNPKPENGNPYKWKKCGNKDCCTESQKEIIRSAYKKLISARCMAEMPSILSAIYQKYKQVVTVECADDAECQKGNYIAQYIESSKTLKICNGIINQDHIDYLAAIILHELVHSIGGNEIDAVALAQSCFSTIPTNWIDEYMMELMSGGKGYCYKYDENGDIMVESNLLVWYPEAGQVYEKASGEDRSKIVTLALVISESLGAKRGWKRDKKWIESHMKQC